MVEYILGNYLVETGQITNEQLTDTLMKQDSVRVKLGLIAVAEGMMTLAQTEEVNRLQAVMDKRFGDIAVSKGYLTDDQIGKLLKKQGDAYMTFIQTLVDSGYMTMIEVDNLLESFRMAKGFSNSEIDALKSDEVERIVPLYIPEAGKKFTDIIVICVRTLIRLLDRRVYVGNAQMVHAFPAEGQVSQSLIGPDGIISCFSELDGALLNLARVFGQEEFDQLDMDALDAAGETLNCINGLYASAESRNGTFLELMPPDYDDVTLKAKTVICRIPIYVGDKGLYFTVADLV
mgnify:FL=1